MTFQEAERKLDRLAQGRYHSIEYRRTRYPSREQRQECGLYIEGTNWFFALTWAKAFDLLTTHLDEEFEAGLRVELETIEGASPGEIT